jgi:penicillin-binding protein 2
MSLTSSNLRKPPKRRRAVASMQVRVALLILFISLAFLGLMARLWFLQVHHGEELRLASEESRTRRIPTRAPRGDIKDRFGSPLADSRQSLALEIEPSYKKTNPSLLDRLAPILHTTAAEIREVMDEENNGSVYAIRVAENLTQGQVAQIEEQRLYMGGAIIQPTPIRHYPVGTIATHLLGYLGMIDAEELTDLKEAGYRAGDYVGKSGIEKKYNALLRGTDGGRDVEVDAAGRVKRVRKEYDALPGHTLLLSIDHRVQWAAQQALAAEGKPGAAVAIDPRNGEVLALASYPTYDIRPFSTRRPKKLWNPLMNDKKNRPLINRAINAQYPPASTFKPIVAAYGLNSGVIPENMTVYCAHGMRIGRQWKG